MKVNWLFNVTINDISVIHVTHQGTLDGYNNPMQTRRTDRHYGIQNCNSSMQNFGVQNEQMNTNAAIIGNVNQNGTHGTVKSRNDLMEINSTHLYGRPDAQMSSSGESRDDYNQMITRNNMMTVPSSMYRNIGLLNSVFHIGLVIASRSVVLA